MLKKFLFLFCLYSFNLHSQSFQAVVCSAGNLSGGFVYYNLGEPVTATVSQSSLTLTEGFIQPIDSNALALNINKDNEASMEILTYPNPFCDYIKLKIKNDNSGKFTIEIIDVLGRRVPVRFHSSGSGQGEQEYIVDTSLITKGNYFIHVISQKQTVKIIKIVKV